MGLRLSILEDPVSELEYRELVTVQPGTPVRQVAAKMRQARLGCAFIVDMEGRPIGKFTERRLLKVLLEGQARLDDPVERFMYASPETICQTDKIEKLLHLMKTRGVRFVCVVDEEGKAIALTGQKGLMEYIAEHFPRSIKVQMMESKLHMDQREGA